MRKYIKEYFANLETMFSAIAASDIDGCSYEFDKAVDSSINMIINVGAADKKLLFIGNGASASIASHMASDFWKNVGIKARTFNDSSLLTSVSNDCGYSHVFEKPIEMFADCGDILIAISSSGKSENILRGVFAAREKGLKVITFSGFNQDNPLRKLGDINFYVPISEYGPVEIIHSAICHCLVDVINKNKKQLTEKAECCE